MIRRFRWCAGSVLSRFRLGRGRTGVFVVRPVIRLGGGAMAAFGRLSFATGPRASRWLSANSEVLTGDAIPERRPVRRRRRGKDGRFCRAPVKPAEAAGPRLSWEEYKKLHGLDQPTNKSEPMECPKRQHGIGCRYKPMGKAKQSPSARDYGSVPKGSHWAA